MRGHVLHLCPSGMVCVSTPAPQPDSNELGKMCPEQPLGLRLVCKSKNVKLVSKDGFFKKKKNLPMIISVFND